ncbi:hypothetical protein SDC9_104536 [bioreactor metagenome]|uniref:Uncharacterized protein n=1 Tax=bioreactor metagenome TaxID=1076179 RepID=A0A645B3I3_9ZZZZ
MTMVRMMITVTGFLLPGSARSTSVTKETTARINRIAVNGFTKDSKSLFARGFFLPCEILFAP